MPYPNEHSARLLDPDIEHIRARRTDGSGDGKVQGVSIPSTIAVIWYIVRTQDGGEAPRAQALRFPTERWTEDQARAWLKSHEIKFILFEPASKKDYKEFHCSIKAETIKEDGGHVFLEGWASTPDVDRDEEIIQPATFEASARIYLAQNPILMYRHRDPAGLVTELSIDKVAGIWIKAFLSKAQSVADVVTMVRERVLRALSVGFIPKDSKDLGNGRREITELELLEISIVPIPANRTALFSMAKALKYGTDLYMPLTEFDFDEVSQKIFEQTMERIKTASVIANSEEPAQEINHNSPAYREFNLAMAEITKALEAEKAARIERVKSDFLRTLNLRKAE